MPKIKLLLSGVALLGALSLNQLSVMSSSAIKLGKEAETEKETKTRIEEIASISLLAAKTITESAPKSAPEDRRSCGEMCDAMSPDMKALHLLISDNSFDLAIEVLGRASHEALNIENDHGYILLSQAVEMTPSSNAVVLVDALVDAGVSIYQSIGNRQNNEWSKRNDLFVACGIGVHPMIFDAILRRRIHYKEWWTRWDFTTWTNRGPTRGYFHLACLSGNYDLVEHLLDIISKEGSVRDLLSESANNIVGILESTVRSFSEDYNIKLIRLCRRFFDDFPNGYSYSYSLCHYEDFSNSLTETYNLDRVVGSALDRGMSSFVLEFATLFPSQKIKQIIWKWTIWNANNISNALPPLLKLHALSYTPSHDEYEAECAKAKRVEYNTRFFHD